MNTVLVVDDDPDIQLLLRLELEAEGYLVLTAANGIEDIDRIAVDEPDVVLLDIMMPELDGWGVLDRLGDTAPAIIVISGLATDRAQHYRHAVEMGALGFVSKPFDSAKLLELVSVAATLDGDQRAEYRQWVLDGGDDPAQRFPGS